MLLNIVIITNLELDYFKKFQKLDPLVIVLGCKKIKLDIYIIKLELLKFIISIVISISNWILMAMSMINWSNLYMIMMIMFSVGFDI